MPTRKMPDPATAAAIPDGEKPPSNRSKAPRQPLQERGRARVEALLDSVEAMLAESEPDNIGFYQIAERAGVPPASMYHFFPTKNAVFLALAERYFDHFRRTAIQPIDTAKQPSWQEVVRLGHQRAVAFYNTHPSAMRLILGECALMDVRSADMVTNRDLVSQTLDEFRRAFHLPFIRDPERKFLIALSIADAIWRVSFAETKSITPAYAEEATRATIAYFRSFLPEILEIRAGGERD